MNRSRVNDILGIKIPIIQAPMSWVTSAELAAAVSNAGGLGTLGPNAGQITVASDVAETGERLRREIHKTRQLTDKPFAVNYLIYKDESTDPYNQEVLKILIEENVRIIAAVGFPNGKEIERLKQLGFTVMFRELTPTAAGAKAAEEAGVDIIVATGFDEGGMTPSNPVGTMTIVPLLADAVNIPVLAAGGIVDKRTVNASFALGAEGVYVGTRFNASKESPASEHTKRAIVMHDTDALVLHRTGFSFNRSIPNKLAIELKELAMTGVSGQEIDKKMNQSGGLKAGMLDGDIDSGVITVSSAVGLIKEIKSCKDIIVELMEDFEITGIKNQKPVHNSNLKFPETSRS